MGSGAFVASAPICLLLLLLSVTRYLARTAYGARCMHRIRDSGELNHRKSCTLLVVLCQWWVILFLALTVELVLTMVSTFSHGSVFDNGPVHGVNWYLHFLSVWCVPACALTYLLGLIGIVLQVYQARRDNDGRNEEKRIVRWHYGLRYTLPYARDVACQVIFMPMLYHIMMCRAVMRQWSVISWEFTDDINYMPLNDTSKANLESQISEADYGVAEMYDAYALWCFGNLGMMVVEASYNRNNRGGGPGVGVGGISDTGVGGNGRGIGDASGVDRGSGADRSSSVDRDDLMREMLDLIQAGILFGVQAYVIVAVASGIYSNVLSLANISQQSDLCGGEAGESGGGFCTFGDIFYGADFATSTIAIYNLFSFEHKLHKPLQAFHPALKFWSMKIPVSLGFAGVLVLNMTKPFTHLSSDQVNLVDALTRALAMPLVALLNLWAWWPWEKWYGWDEVRGDGSVDGNPFTFAPSSPMLGSELLAAGDATS